MQWYQEVTEWPGATPNHTYLLDDAKRKMFAYVRVGGAKAQVFPAPRNFDPARRKFVKVADRWHVDLDAGKPQGRSWTVTGSRGDQYTVTEQAGTWNCTCAGFQFRGKCKHVTELSK